MTGRINIVNTYILPKAIYIFTVVSFEIPRHFSQNRKKILQLVWKCCCSVARSCLTLCDSTDYNTPDFPVCNHVLEFAQVHAHWIADAIQPSHPLSPSFSSASIYPSIRVFYNQTAIHIRWPKYWRFSFSISPSEEYMGLISFNVDWIDLLGAQGLSRAPEFKNISSSALCLLYCLSSFYMRTWLLERT